MNSFETRFNIGKLPFGLRGAAPILIAETACAHDGSADEAMRLVDASVEAGADMVQLQVSVRPNRYRQGTNCVNFSSESPCRMQIGRGSFGMPPAAVKR